MSEDRRERERNANLFDPIPDLSDGQRDVVSLDGVEAELRFYAKAIVDFRRQFLKGAAVDAPAFFRAEAERMARIFLGEDNAVKAGVTVTTDLNVGVGDDRAKLEAFFAKLAADLQGLIAQHEGGVLSEDATKFRLDALIEDAAHRLLGIPLDPT